MTSQSLLFKLLAFYGTRLNHPGQWRVLDRLRKWLDADVDEELEVVRGGNRWILNPSDFVHADIFWTGVKDHWDVWHLKRMLAANCVFLDVGANLGYYAVHLASQLGPESRAWAFEPFPANFQRLEKNIALNQLESRVTACPVGLSNEQREGQMSMREGNLGSANLNVDSTEKGTTVSLTTLDAFWAETKQSRLDFVKIDVEGHEASMLRGGEKVLREQLPLILIELDPTRLREANSSLDEVLLVLSNWGYVLYQSERKKLVPLRPLGAADLLNAFAFHRSSHASILETLPSGA